MDNMSLGHREDPAEYKYEDDEDSNDEDNVRDVILHQYCILSNSLTLIHSSHPLLIFIFFF
jgi:hypothetical protein